MPREIDVVAPGGEPELEEFKQTTSSATGSERNGHSDLEASTEESRLYTRSHCRGGDARCSG
jgi:hypothetical protein